MCTHGKAIGLALLLCAVVPIRSAAAEPTRAPKPKPAQLKISGYGLLGNRELRRMLVTLEWAGKVPDLLTPTFVEDAALTLAARIKRDGYLHPAIEIQLTTTAGGQIRVNAAGLLDNPLSSELRFSKVRFIVHKGVLFYFQSLQFTGLQTVPLKQAYSYFEQTETLFHLKRGRIFTPDRLDSGIEALTGVLDQQGYREAQARVTQLAQNDRTGAVAARLQVQQGPQFIVRTVQEDFTFSNAPAPARIKIVHPNQPYSHVWQQDFVLSLKTNLYHQGFPDTTVKVTTAQRQSIAGREELRLLASVSSGPRVRIAAVEFRGQRRTRPALMKRSVRIERGEWLDPIAVEAGRYRLAKLGIFDKVDLQYRTVDEAHRQVIYELTEGKTLNLSLLFGWGSYDLLMGGVEAEVNNIWGLAHHANIKAIQSFKSTSGDFTYTIPELVGRDIELFVNSSGLRRQEIDFTRLEYGGSIGLHKYFAAQSTDITARYNYSILNALDFSTVQEVASEGLTNPAVGSVMFDIKYDRRDNPLYPHRGYKVFLSLQTATSYLGGEANFQRVEFSPSWHHPLGGGRYLSLGVSHGVDISFGSPANNLPFNSRFFPGGESSIRGYQETEASPRNSLGQLVGAETYTLGTVELEQALTAKWSVVLFSDSLGFAEHLNHYPVDTALFSVGVGLRWHTLIGPVRLEYGHNLNPRPGDPSGTVLFSLGYPF
ncbi:MAG TPA: BamA/TamA family outer membrane protein [Verrucomicrobiae bacterium]|nr:BamA/TamA family outer membrane protein [Verrucomicrobiae bacterium]